MLDGSAYLGVFSTAQCFNTSNTMLNVSVSVSVSVSVFVSVSVPLSVFDTQRCPLSASRCSVWRSQHGSPGRQRSSSVRQSRPCWLYCPTTWSKVTILPLYLPRYLPNPNPISVQDGFTCCSEGTQILSFRMSPLASCHLQDLKDWHWTEL